MRKKILFLLIAIVTFTVGNSDVYAEDITITAQAKRILYQSDTFMALGEVSACQSGKDYTIYYILDGGETKTGGSGFCSDTTPKFSISIERDNSQISNKAEHAIEMWIADENGNESNHVIQEFLLINGFDEEISDNNGILNLSTYKFVDLHLTTTKVTDQSIIDRLGTKDVYKVNFVSDGKDLSYYINKYSVDLTFGYNGSIKLPSDLTNNSLMGAYMTNSDFSYVSTLYDCVPGSSDCNGIYEGAGMYMDNIYDGGYIYFKDGDYAYNDNGTTDKAVKVPDTFASNSIIVLIMGICLSIIGVVIIDRTLIKKKNDIVE